MTHIRSDPDRLGCTHLQQLIRHEAQCGLFELNGKTELVTVVDGRVDHVAQSSCVDVHALFLGHLADRDSCEYLLSLFSSVVPAELLLHTPCAS